MYTKTRYLCKLGLHWLPLSRQLHCFEICQSVFFLFSFNIRQCSYYSCRLHRQRSFLRLHPWTVQAGRLSIPLTIFSVIRIFFLLPFLIRLICKHGSYTQSLLIILFTLFVFSVYSQSRTEHYTISCLCSFVRFHHVVH